MVHDNLNSTVGTLSGNTSPEPAKEIELCQYLEWDSGFFQRRIARVTGNRLSRDMMDPIMNWCELHRIDCLYFLADSDDGTTIRLAEDNAFRCVDIRMTLERRLEANLPLDEKMPQGIIRPFVAQDVAALRAIARNGYRDSRFFFDPNFSPALASALYETWITKSCNGYADTVLAAEIQGQPVGYISCHLSREGIGQIGLAGVSPDWEGGGIGRALLNASLGWFAGRGATRVVVVTQGRNYRAQRLYQAGGFLTKAVQLWYHCWFVSDK
jgi:GNAT superfamily N-acetyltransferase